jgi:integrase/recombinase XerD
MCPAKRRHQVRCPPSREALEMPKRRERYLGSLIDEYLNALMEGGRASKFSAKKYRYVLVNALRALHAAGLETSPTKIGKEEIEHLRRVEYIHLRPKSAHWQIAILGTFLKHYGNNVVEQMKIVWPQDGRTRVDWLSPEEAIRVVDAAQGVERIVVHLELRLGLRRIEVLRLTVEDVREQIMDVHGKGRGGGKWRTLAWAPDTRVELEHYLSLREEMIAQARRRNRKVEEPEAFLIYRKGGKLYGYERTGVDNMVHAAAKRAGITRPVGNHTLRRTCGRLMHYAGVPLVDIAEAFGHSDVKTTMRYLGLTVDDLSRAQEKTLSFLDQVRNGMKSSPVKLEPLIRVRD